jgi:hypothetical protein
MYKVTVKRYGFPRWDGSTPIRKFMNDNGPPLSEATKLKVVRDNTDFISTIKTLRSVSAVLATDEEAAAGLSFTVEYCIEDAEEAAAVLEFFNVKAPQRMLSLSPNSGIVIQATMSQV